MPEEVGWGLYSIEEIQAPEGYLIRRKAARIRRQDRRHRRSGVRAGH
ncbi:MAG: hypothetical protein ACLSCX_08220 [Oscillospiraceae bacterium]